MSEEQKGNLFALIVATVILLGALGWLMKTGGCSDEGRLRHDLEDSGFSCEQRDRTPGGWDLNCHR